MCTKNVSRFGRSVLTSAAACVFALVAIGVSCQKVSAQEGSVAPRAMQARADMAHSAELEKAFWVCDYTATTRGVYAAPIELCSAVTDQLKREKFGGDFGQMLEWWQQNKPVEHANLASGAW
ncbi:MAG TPA: hypothetical protein VGO08_23330 [Burkholderiales bacterium]|nr:hypothetical protein [Burkholderiales bacterium]